MKISVLDAGNYFRGLLLLVRKDRKIAQSESELMRRIGRTLGFEREFCENAIRDILENGYIEDAPPVFSTRELALKFIRDGIVLAYADNECDHSEERWLRSVAERNGIEPGEFSRELEEVVAGNPSSPRLEVDSLTVMYFGPRCTGVGCT